MDGETMESFVILGSPAQNAVPRVRVRDFKIVKETPVLSLVKRLRASARRLRDAMGDWCNAPDRNFNGRIYGEMVKWRRRQKDGFVEKRIVTDEKVRTRWNELCSRMAHLKIRDFGGMPFMMFGEHLGGEAHIDISQGDIECDGSAEALVERMMLKHASDQLWLGGHGLYTYEYLCVSKDDCLKHGDSDCLGFTSFAGKPEDTAFAVRAGYAESGAPVFEFVSVAPYGGDSGTFRWRAIRDDAENFGVARGIARKFALKSHLVTCF